MRKYDHSQVNVQDSIPEQNKLSNFERAAIVQETRIAVGACYPDSGVVVVWLGKHLHVSITAHPGVADYAKLKHVQSRMYGEAA